MYKWIALCSFIIVSAMPSNGLAGGAGTLTVTCKYFDDKRVEQPLAGAFVYLRDQSKKPHDKPSYILGPSDSWGRVTVSVPEGSYYIRITKRNPQNGNTNKFGPPEPTDYTWSQTSPVRVSANVTTDIGTVYAGLFIAPISVTGTVTRATGDPAAGLSIQAQKEPCYSDADNGDVSQSGTFKVITRKRTDANGQYTLVLRDPGTYYIYVSRLVGRDGSMSGASSCGGDYAGAVTVSLGDTKTLDIVTNY